MPVEFAHEWPRSQLLGRPAASISRASALRFLDCARCNVVEDNGRVFARPLLNSGSTKEAIHCVTEPRARPPGTRHEQPLPTQDSLYSKQFDDLGPCCSYRGGVLSC